MSDGVDEMDTPRERLIAAGVREFAAEGFTGASMRRLTAAAGTNVAAVKYYFGSKEGLYHAVVERFFAQIQPERMALLAEARAQPPERPGRVDSVLHAMVAPHLRLMNTPGGEPYLRLLARFSSEPRDITIRVYQEEIRPMRERLIDVLAESLPELARPRLIRLFGFVATVMVVAPFDRGYQAMLGDGDAATDPEDLIDVIVSFCAAGLCHEARRAREEGPVTG